MPQNALGGQRSQVSAFRLDIAVTSHAEGQDLLGPVLLRVPEHCPEAHPLLQVPVLLLDRDAETTSE